MTGYYSSRYSEIDDLLDDIFEINNKALVKYLRKLLSDSIMDVHIDGNVVYCVDPDGEYVLADCNEEKIPEDESDDEEEVKRQLDELRDLLLAYKENSQENQLDDKMKRQLDELNKVKNPTDMVNIACESMEIQKSIVRHEGRIKRIIQRAQQQDQHHGDAQNTK